MSNRNNRSQRSNRNRRRDYDDESGMQRVSRSYNRRSERRRRDRTPESEGSFTESEVEEFVQAPVRDDTRRTNTRVLRPSNQRGSAQQVDQNANEAGPDEVKPVDPKPVTPSTSFTFLLAAARSSTFAPVTYPEPSELIPFAGNMFIVVQAMIRAVGENTKLFSVCPDFSSVGLHLYYSFVYYYQILRARESCGLLTRFERRTLKIFQSIGEPEAWPIATPLIGFVQALGSCEPDNKMFSYICPKFVDFEQFKKDSAFAECEKVTGLARTPLVPMLQKILRSLGKDGLTYDDDDSQFLVTPLPFGTPTGNDEFLGIKKSDKTNLDFQTVSNSAANFIIYETNETIGEYTLAQRQTRINRWKIPDVLNNASFETMEGYLFGDQKHTSWIRELLRISTQVNKFFPGSINLAAIPPTTTAENFTQISYYTKGKVELLKDSWLGLSRTNWLFNADAKYFGDVSNPLLQASTTTAINAVFHQTTISPTLKTHLYGTIKDVFSPSYSGPYFIDTNDERTRPLKESEICGQKDTMSSIQELISSTMYDNSGSN